ncbi:MAG TPA: SDR family oxidoreductase [Puia sp.]|jgi:NAD(P)-dependent dehydrogenase (short-subunit alcohol dehydrogenase family)
MPVELNFNGKTVLITGVTSGIGAAIAGLFARAGASVAGCGLPAGDSLESARFISSASSQYAGALYVQADVTKEDQLKNLVDKTIGKFKKIDVLVSNAGANVFEGAADCTEEEWLYNAELNLASHWRLAKMCKPWLERQKGVIILMSSNHAYSTIPGCFPYSVAKTALTGLVRSLAIEWAPAIRTVGIAPGFIETAASQKWFGSFPEGEAERLRTIQLHPVKRLGTPEEVGAWCVFLASDYASFASGTTYLLDGGRSALLQDS